MAFPLVHVGYQKTGSTFLQQRVFSNQDLFFAPWGSQSTDALDHFVLAHPERFNPADVRAQLQSPDGRIPVVSHEDLLGYPVHARYHAEQVVARISAALPDARILLCIRNQNDILLSNYFQYVRQGGTKTLTALLKDNVDRPGFSPHFRLDHFEYHLMHQLLCRHFPTDQICVLPLEMLKRDQFKFMQALGGFLGVDLPLDTNTTPVNTRDSLRTLELQRNLNKFIQRPAQAKGHYSDLPLSLRLRDKALSLSNKISVRLGGEGKGLIRLHKIIANHVGNYYAASNTRTSEVIDITLSDYGYTTR